MQQLAIDVSELHEPSVATFEVLDDAYRGIRAVVTDANNLTDKDANIGTVLQHGFRRYMRETANAPKRAAACKNREACQKHAN